VDDVEVTTIWSDRVDRAIAAVRIKLDQIPVARPEWEAQREESETQVADKPPIRPE
jgi:hypothetical protein